MRNIKHLNLTIDINTYHEAKRNIPRGQVSQLFSDFLKNYLKKQRKEQLRQQLIKGYQDNAKNKELQKELEIYDEATGDGLNNEK
jgi:hypothetical protein